MKKKKNLKKLLIILPICVVVIAGIIIGLIAARKNSERAYVQPVEYLNNQWVISSSSYPGVVAESAQDNISVSSEDPVTEVYVKEGDKVKKGDKLFEYDTESLKIKVEEKQLSANYCQTLLERQQTLLETYRNIIPYVPEEEEPSEAIEDQLAASEAQEEQPAEEQQPETQSEPRYTAQEKADMITNQELQVSKAKTALEKAKEELNIAQKALENATVCAKIDGTVSKIGRPGLYSDSASAFCTVIGTTGVTVKGYVGEFDLNTVKVGDTLSVVSYMSGEASNAEIICVNDYPVDGDTGYSRGNPNTSFYEFSAFIENAEGFSIGENVEITKENADIENIIVLEKIFIRTDSEGAYVLKDENGKLARQPVTVEKTNDSNYVIVKEGLSGDELIAFPHGPLAKVGLLTTTEQKNGLF